MKVRSLRATLNAKFILGGDCVTQYCKRIYRWDVYKQESIEFYVIIL